MALPDNALTTLAAVKDEFDVVGDAYADRYVRMIAEASDAIEGYCEREFRRQSTTEKLQPSGTPLLVMDRRPIVSITSISYDGEELDPEEYELENAKAGIIRLVSGVWQPLDLVAPSPAMDGIPGTSRKLVSVTYVAGYVLPKDATDEQPRTLPYDLERACLMTVSQIAWRKGRNLSIASEPDENGSQSSVSYRSPNVLTGLGRGGVIPDEALTILNSYRRKL